MHLTSSLTGSWPLLLGAAVVATACVLLWRAVRRHAADESPQERRSRRGRMTEDVLTIAVACIAAALSANALVTYAEHVLGLTHWWRLLPFGGLDTAAVVCAIRARRRANAGQAAGINSVLVWVLAGISAAFSASAASGLWGAIGHGIWALVAATLWELGLLEQRRQRQERPDRSLGLIRWLHPWERVQVLAELAADTEITADEATARVRERRAARALYKLHLADAAHRASGQGKDEPLALRRAERRAQRAAARVRLAEPEVEAQVMPQLRVLCEVRQIAATGGRPRQTAASGATPPAGGAPLSPTLARQEAHDAPPLAPKAAMAQEPEGSWRATASAEPTVAAAVAAEDEAVALTPAAPPALDEDLAATEQPEPVAVGFVAADVMAAGVPRQATGGDEGGDELDPRVMRLVELLEADARLTGADAARELGVAVRTGQRLHRSARQLQQALQLVEQDPSATEDLLARELELPTRDAARLHQAATVELARRAVIGHESQGSVERDAMPIG